MITPHLPSLSETTEVTLRQTVEHALSYLASLPNAPVGATTSTEELRRRLHRPLPENGIPPAQVISDLVADIQGGLTQNAGGRFFGWVIGGTLPAALAADWLTSTWDQTPGVHAVSPAGSLVDEVCGKWLLELLELPQTASFALVTGCQMAHVTCLAAARNAVLTTQGWDVEQRGLFGAPPIRVLTSDRRHGTNERALRLLGFGRDCVTDIPAHKHLMAGVELADSWATDGHKWLNVPYDCGYAFVAQNQPHFRSMSHHASYLHQSSTERDPVDWTPEHSRRARGFATYAALRSLGKEGVGHLVAECCRHARAIVEGASLLPGVEVVHFPKRGVACAFLSAVGKPQATTFAARFELSRPPCNNGCESGQIFKKNQPEGTPHASRGPGPELEFTYDACNRDGEVGRHCSSYPTSSRRPGAACWVGQW